MNPPRLSPSFQKCAYDARVRTRLLPLLTHLAASALFVTISQSALAADLTVGVVPSSLKVRPDDQPPTSPSASIRAARNEFEAFQIVMRAGTADVAQVTAKVSKALVGPGAAQIPAKDVVLYAERYYDVGTASNDEGAPGPWPDPLVPDVDTYFGETRNAFPLTVPLGKTRVVWVDVQIPIDQAPGDYVGEIEIDVAGVAQAAVPIALHVGTFSLPSTATLASAFGMGWNTAPLVHCGGAFPYCGGDADKSNAIRALYLRSALEHRFTISNTDFQPPFGGDQALFEKHVLPLIDGSATTRLPGARLTTVVLDGGKSSLATWLAYAKSKNFADRLFYYPVDEPGTNAGAWTNFTSESDALHVADPTAEIILTTSMQDAQQFSAAPKIDIFVPVLDQMWGRPSSGYDGDQRGKYDAWLATASPAKRKLWMYQSCDQHGCGSCGTPSPGADYAGWPSRVVDSSGVQDRAFEWWSFLEKTSGELYFETTYQLATAWTANGQCAFSGSGDGTLFYPGKPSLIGGVSDIPIESIRMKMIREGMEDYEYLVQVALKDPSLARSIALGLFPNAYDCHKSPAALEAARKQLFDLLDSPVSTGDGGPNPGADGGADAGTNGGASGSSGGCDCNASSGSGFDALGLLVALGLVLRRARRAQPSSSSSISHKRS